MNSNSKRIAKNTLFLYIRMAVLMIVTLFTSRIVLDKLGVEDFGIYNVVGGVAAVFTFFSSSLANATQRFLNIELGKGNIEGARNIFSQHLAIYLFLVIGMVVLAETVGLWLVHHKLVIAPERMSAALWTYQFAVLALCVSFIGIVFNSAIIAHEDMRIYSYVGIADAFLRLTIAYAISVVEFDRLVTYSILLLLVALCVQGSYAIYALRRYKECQLCFSYDKDGMWSTFNFISWNVVGTVIFLLKDQGVNILLNLFFGPVVNAARAVSFQVSAAISNFSNNFYMSVQPQIVKSYAAGERAYLNTLFLNSTKYSLFLMWLFCLPVMLEIVVILNLWLKEVPQGTEIFTRWVLADALLSTMTAPAWTVVLAVGRLKKYTLLCNGCLLLIFPLSYLFLSLGYGPVSVFVITFVVRILQVISSILFANTYIHFGISAYFKRVIYPVICVYLLSGSVSLLVWKQVGNGFLALFAVCVVTFLSTVVAVYYIGLDKSERMFCLDIMKSRWRSFRNIFH